jgi:flagellar biosynthesis protein
MRRPKPLTAVAIKYQAHQDPTPRVVAKGKHSLAQRIIDAARSQGVPLREDPALVDALYQLDIQEEIPPKLYQALAEVLAYIYRMDQGEARGSAFGTGKPVVQKK